MSCGRALGYTGGGGIEKRRGRGRDPPTQDELFLVLFHENSKGKAKCSGTVHHGYLELHVLLSPLTLKQEIQELILG